MRTGQGNMLQSLRNVEAFLEENADTLDGVVKTGARQRLAKAITELAAHTSEQTGNTLASQGATKRQQALRKALLRDHMAPIVRIAEADLPKTPDVEPLRMPLGKPPAQKLAAAAYGMAKAASPHADVFTSAGLPGDFVAQLTGAADAMLASVDERSRNHGKRTGATKGLKSKLTAGRKIVHVLDAFVQSALKDDPARLADWNAVKRVKAPNRPTVPATPAPAPTPIPTPTPAQVAAAGTN
jgi:hypothetical protein